MRKKVTFMFFIIIYCFIIRNMFHVFFPFMCAFLCFFMLKPLIDYLENHFSLKRSAVGISLLLVIYLLIALIIGLGLSFLLIWLGWFVKDIPVYYQEYIIPISNQIVGMITQRFSFIMSMDIITTLEDNLYQIVIYSVEHFSIFMSYVPRYVFAFFIFLISTFYLVLEYDEMKDKCLLICSSHFIQELVEVKNNALKSIIIYMKCQLSLMFICFMLLWIGFSILHFPYSFLYALFISFLDSLPFIGVGIILIPMIIFFIIQSHYLMAFYILLIYLIINLLRSILEPHIMNKQTKVPSFIFLLSMVVHLYLFGFIGVFLSPIHVNVLFEFFQAKLVNKK